MAAAASSSGVADNAPTRLELIERSLTRFVSEQLRRRHSPAADCEDTALDADPSLYSYLEAVLTDDVDECGDDDVLELLRAHVTLLETAPDSELRAWLADCRRRLAEASAAAVAALTTATSGVADSPSAGAGFATATSGWRLEPAAADASGSCDAAAKADAAEEAAETLGRMRALFPEACAVELRRLLADACGDLQAAVNLCLEVVGGSGPADCPRGVPCACLEAEASAAAAGASDGRSDSRGVKSYIMDRFENYELPDERKVHRPEARFDERPRLTRYLDSRVVAQNGARYVEIKDEREEEIRKATTVCIRPARKYRFH